MSNGDFLAGHINDPNKLVHVCMTVRGFLQPRVAPYTYLGECQRCEVSILVDGELCSRTTQQPHPHICLECALVLRGVETDP